MCTHVPIEASTFSCFQAAAALYTAGTVLQSLAPNLLQLLAGRMVYGLGVGFTLHVAPLYIAESVPAELRGQVVALKEAAIVTGLVFGYISGSSSCQISLCTCAHRWSLPSTYARNMREESGSGTWHSGSRDRILLRARRQDRCGSKVLKASGSLPRSRGSDAEVGITPGRALARWRVVHASGTRALNHSSPHCH